MSEYPWRRLFNGLRGSRHTHAAHAEDKRGRRSRRGAPVAEIATVLALRRTGEMAGIDHVHLIVAGELSMAGFTRPLTAQLTVDDGGSISGTIPLV